MFGLRSSREVGCRAGRCGIRPRTTAGVVSTRFTHDDGLRRTRRAGGIPRCQPSLHDVEDPTTTSLDDLRVELEKALKTEDYRLAARLRDSIQKLQVDARVAVEDANKKFYAAFMSGSVQTMGQVWGQGDHIQVIHPGSNCIAGRAAVMESWKSILAGVRPRAFRIDLEDVRVYATESHGYVTCVEVVDADDAAGRVCATNIFEKQDGKWVLVMHQGGPAAPPPRRRKP